MRINFTTLICSIFALLFFYAFNPQWIHAQKCAFHPHAHSLHHFDWYVYCAFFIFAYYIAIEKCAKKRFLRYAHRLPIAQCMHYLLVLNNGPTLESQVLTGGSEVSASGSAAVSASSDSFPKSCSRTTATRQRAVASGAVVAARSEAAAGSAPAGAPSDSSHLDSSPSPTTSSAAEACSSSDTGGIPAVTAATPTAAMLAAATRGSVAGAAAGMASRKTSARLCADRANVQLERLSYAAAPTRASDSAVRTPPQGAASPRRCRRGCHRRRLSRHGGARCRT